MLLAASLDQATKDALRVQHVLKTIERHRPGDRGSAEVTEQELNAFIDYRLKQEEETLIRRLSLQLLGEDRVRGNLTLDAGRLNLGAILGDNLTFDFNGRVATRGGAIRLDLEALSHNGQAVQPVVVDMVLKAVSIYHGRDIGGMHDWYELPKGVDRVRVEKGKVVLFYI